MSDIEGPLTQEEQFKRLKECSDKKDMSDWNNWHEQAHSINEINLSELNLSGMWLKGVNFSYANLEGTILSFAHLEGADLREANLNKAILVGTHMEKDSKGNSTKLYGAKFECTNFTNAYIQGAEMPNANLATATLDEVHFEEANLSNVIFYNKISRNYLFAVHFEGAKLISADFTNTDIVDCHFEKSSTGKQTYLPHAAFKNTTICNTNFTSAKMNDAYLIDTMIWEVNFENADLSYVILEGALITGDKIKTNIKGTDFSGVTVNDRTRVLICDIDEKTNFYAVNLDSAQVEPSLLSALKTNIRRIAWNKYYDEEGKSLWGKIKTAPMRFFWWLSDYGSSSERIFLSILISILLFTNAYLIISILAPNVISLPEQGTATSRIVPVSGSYIRILCFAISTMVTLGFGGINVTIDKAFQGWSNFAFLAVTFNLVLGYLFLSVLVTRFGILFQSQAPEQKSKKTNNTLLYFISLILFASSSYMLFCWKDITGFMNYAALVAILFMMPYCRFK